MPPRRRRRRGTPTPAQIWRILHAAAREARIATRDRAELRRQLAREAAAREEKFREEEEARNREYQQAEEARKREAAALEEQFRREDEERKREAKVLARRYAAADEARKRAQADRDRRFDERMNRMQGDIAGRWGVLMEALVRGDLERVLQDAGVEVTRVLCRVLARNRNGAWREFDLVALEKSGAVIVEVKTTLTREDVTLFAERIGEFRECFPEYGSGTVRGGVAYLTTDQQTPRLAESTGFYVIRSVGAGARLVNSEGFEPRFF